MRYIIREEITKFQVTGTEFMKHCSLRWFFKINIFYIIQNIIKLVLPVKSCKILKVSLTRGLLWFRAAMPLQCRIWSARLDVFTRQWARAHTASLRKPLRLISLAFLLFRGHFFILLCDLIISLPLAALQRSYSFCSHARCRTEASNGME